MNLKNVTEKISDFFFFNVWQVSANLSKSGTQEAGLITEPAQPSTSIFAGAYVGQTLEIDCEDYCLFNHCCCFCFSLLLGFYCFNKRLSLLSLHFSYILLFSSLILLKEDGLHKLTACYISP